MKTWNINTDTPLIPYIIAERAVWNVLEYGKPELMPNECAAIVDNISPALVAKAERLYVLNEGFRKSINDKRKDCRYTLEMYMEHWSHRLIKDYFKQQLTM